MKTLEMIWKVAGGGERILNIFPTRFRAITGRSIFTRLAGERLCKRKCRALVLLWSVAIAAVVFVLNAPVSAQTTSARRKVVVTMDTTLHVYDQSNIASGRTNADEIKDTLSSIKELSVIKETTSSEWRGEEQLRAKNPDLVIIHLSAFVSRPRTPASEIEEERKLISFFQYMAGSNAQLLIYSRRPSLEDEQGQKDWIQSMERKAPGLKGRIQVFTFGGAPPKRFRDRQVQQALRTRVKNMLGIR